MEALSPDQLPKAEAAPVEVPTLSDIIQLGATDLLFYSKQWFPKVARQGFASFHRPMADIITGPGRKKMLMVRRDGAKTTLARLGLSQRCAYGISKTILILGKSENHSRRTIKWLKNQVLWNKQWAAAFGLRQGKKWTDIECEILRYVPGMDAPERIHIIGMGITGSIRGINMDDWRPDFILLDDVLDEENSATPEQREKNESLIYGAVIGSLAPASEEPMACVLALQTPLNREDYSVKAEFDSGWVFFRASIWTEETASLPIEQRESSWPERYPSEECRALMLEYMGRNKLSVFLREYECRVASPESCTFRAEWFRRWEVLPKLMTHILVIDPVPPPTEVQRQKGNIKNDYEALTVLGGFGGQYFVREISVNRGHEPNWTCAEFWRLCGKYRPQWIIVESVAYQTVLAWLLRQTMRQRGIYFPIQEFKDTRSKFHRITDGLTGPASEGALFFPPDDAPEGFNHSEGVKQFFQQFSEYPNVSHDDALESVAVGLLHIAGKVLAADEHAHTDEEELMNNPAYYFRGADLRQLEFKPGENAAP